MHASAGTVFAYGATGAGKTYTMSGHEQIIQSGGTGSNGRSRGRTRGPPGGGDGGGGRGCSKTEGLIPRSMRYLFERISALPYGVTMRIRASFYEIYNEVVYDLLTQDDRRPLQVGAAVTTAMLRATLYPANQIALFHSFFYFLANG